jgi:AcrR family transcriptional regulator
MSSEASAPVSPRRARTRERLVEAAVQAIADKGFHAATLDEIAARAGLTKGAIYDNFESKDALFLAAVGAATSARVERFSWPVGREGEVRARLRALARAVIADADAARLEAPMRAELLLYTLTHDDMRQRIGVYAKQRFAQVEARVLELFAPEELPTAPDKFVILLEALVPGLMFLRAQAPDLITDEAIVAVFEALA